MDLIKRAIDRLRGAPEGKEGHELLYWQERKKAEGRLQNGHYQPAYTHSFGLTTEAYARKRVLDVGCGPRGSLEWATMALERVGLDPLADRYRSLGTDAHQMRYVAAPAEAMPFDDGYFDIVTSMNSLDHVDDLDRTIAEIIRVLKPGGLFLLASDLHEEPTDCEPIVFSWEIVGRFQPALVLESEQHYEKHPDGLYQTLEAAVPFDHANPERRYGVVTAKFTKPL